MVKFSLTAKAPQRRNDSAFYLGAGTGAMMGAMMVAMTEL